MSKKVIVSKGKNVEEAINTGLELLQARRREVDIEIMEVGTAGLFGIFGSKPAKVRLIKNDLLIAVGMDLSPNTESSETGDKWPSPISYDKKKPNHKPMEMGKVWIKEGKIFCKETAMHYPTVTPVEGVSLYRNGELVIRKTIISEKDHLKIECNHECKETEWSIEIDEANMAAFLFVQPGYKRIRKLFDQEASHHIKLAYTEAEEIINHLQFQQVKQEMEVLGINTGINQIEIIKACETWESGKYEIARGIEPQKGQDGWLELKVNTKHQKNGPKMLENGMVDVRELQTIPTVDAGQVIAVVHPCTEGKSGLSITGDTMLPPLSKDLTVQIKQGADRIDQGRKIVAMNSGKPYIEYKGSVIRISIMPQLYHASNVDLASGNLRFIGDVEVQGNIEEKMTVEALGDVLIHGMTNGSTILAGNRMIVRESVINSHLTAGKSNLWVAELGQCLKDILEELEVLSTAIAELSIRLNVKTSDLTHMGLSSLVRILLEHKFKTFPPLVKKFSDMTAKADQLLDDEYKEVAMCLVDGFLKFAPTTFRSQEELARLIQRVKSLYEYSLTPAEPEASISIPYALNAEIYCSGDVSIIDQGCIQTKIHCGGKLQVNGMIRGGEVFAAMGADIGESGSPGGIPTRIKVPDGQTIKIKYVMEGTHLQIGDRTYSFLKPDYDVFAHVDRRGHLLLHL